MNNPFETSFIPFKKLSNLSKLLIQISESNHSSTTNNLLETFYTNFESIIRISESNHSSTNDLKKILLSTNDLKLPILSYLSKKLSNPSKLLIHHLNLRVQLLFNQQSKENSSMHEWSPTLHSFILSKKLSNPSKLLIQISESNHSSARNNLFETSFIFSKKSFQTLNPSSESQSPTTLQPTI